ncbi:DUF2231 domain-containing protein [Kineosporia succinea]|uniref:MFS superfamily sulfate permease-like transporter n=1 Tax=Kineosporia succinea TaxID=84632 RepID=A0ABT9PCB4_9ACTN|nr:DUF2231 domain-containing protein [Kineosporia succinea]MDP9830353.1 MFS superfamily sulfate permease-like transporter [Kineosporia succinea]
MPETVGGIPIHPLIVHATVVAVPLAALLVALAALWPRCRRWAGPLPGVMAAVALALYPVTTASGESLEHRVGPDPLIEKHSHLADGLLPWLIILLVAAAAVTWLWWQEAHPRSAPARRPLVLVAIGLIAVLAAVGTVQQVVRIGHSGAESAWGDSGGS